jgi:hypothetical protein
MTCLQAAVEFILELQLDDEPDSTPSAPHTHTHTMSNAESQSPSCVVLNSGPDNDCSENNSENENENENTVKGSCEGCGMAGDVSRSHGVEANCASTTPPSSFASPSSLAASSANTFSVVRMQVQDPNMSPHSDLGRDRDREKKRDKDFTADCADRDGDREGDGNRSLKPPKDDGYAAVIKLGEM